ncbi:MFS transporter [Pseudooceanicola nanhaiensis]|uniref:MFS transporter n=1 Tax=Pseudooceanicola nanhaiensis TaxID=375761 RepID=UPI001CD3B789|nr:MFS transporter [Pseudooceanicola nanhaiensis]MCA0922435.1 MFS transporter [Pseudooceanicola nanhaiensis]
MTTTDIQHSPASAAFARIAGVDPDEIDATEGRNGLRHIASLSLSKVADGLIDPKLVLSWLLNALGAPGAYAGALVPIREAGALLPQVLLADWIETLAHRKWVWAAGSALQGIAALAIAAAGWLLEGAAAGLAICLALAVLACARAACSVSYKDVQGRTIAKTRRGAVTGLAGSAASAGVVIFALLLISGLLQERGPVLIAIALAGVFWLGAALVFAGLDEPEAERGAGEGLALWAALRDDADLRRFILVRGLLVSTSLAPPWIVMLSGQDQEGALLGQLGAMLLASAAASFLSSYVWGRLSDYSSRLTLALSGAAAAVALAVGLALDWAGMIGAVWAGPAVLFGLMIAYHGVRQARSTYLVDMAPEDSRTAYAAAANTVIGVLLLLAGALGGALSIVGPEAALAGYAVMALAGGALAMTLREVEQM